MPKWKLMNPVKKSDAVALACVVFNALCFRFVFRVVFMDAYTYDKQCRWGAPGRPCHQTFGWRTKGNVLLTNAWRWLSVIKGLFYLCVAGICNRGRNCINR